jgi:hypothetical protein
MMPDYRMYCLNGVGKISSAETIVAASDEEAMAAVRAKKLSVRCEVWHGNRLVGTVAPGGAYW